MKKFHWYLSLSPQFHIDRTYPFMGTMPLLQINIHINQSFRSNEAFVQLTSRSRTIFRLNYSIVNKSSSFSIYIEKKAESMILV